MVPICLDQENDCLYYCCSYPSGANDGPSLAQHRLFSQQLQEYRCYKKSSARRSTQQSYRDSSHSPSSLCHHDETSHGGQILAILLLLLDHSQGPSRQSSVASGCGNGLGGLLAWHVVHFGRQFVSR